MKKILAFALVAGLAACGDKTRVAQVSETPAPQAVAAAIEDMKPDPDRELALQIGHAMEEAKLYGIDVVAKDGVVTLWGTTLNAPDQARASQIAAGIDGVKAVENRLQVVAGS